MASPSIVIAEQLPWKELLQILASLQMKACDGLITAFLSKFLSDALSLGPSFP